MVNCSICGEEFSRTDSLCRHLKRKNSCVRKNAIVKHQNTCPVLDKSETVMRTGDKRQYAANDDRSPFAGENTIPVNNDKKRKISEKKNEAEDEEDDDDEDDDDDDDEMSDPVTDPEEVLPVKIKDTVEYLIRHDKAEINKLLKNFLHSNEKDDVIRLCELVQILIEKQVATEKEIPFDNIKHILVKLQRSSILGSKLFRL